MTNAELTNLMNLLGQILHAVQALHRPKPEQWKIQRICGGCITATWCNHFKRCLAETVPTSVTGDPNGNP